MEEKIPVTNEMTTSQRPAIQVLQKLGYEYISEEQNKVLRNNNLADVILVRRKKELIIDEYWEFRTV